MVKVIFTNIIEIDESEYLDDDGNFIKDQDTLDSIAFDFGVESSKFYQEKDLIFCSWNFIE